MSSLTTGTLRDLDISKDSIAVKTLQREGGREGEATKNVNRR